LSLRDAWFESGASGLLSPWLGFDDVFRFRDVPLPNYLGLPQPVIYAGYGGVVRAYLIGRRLVGRTELDLLGPSLAAFALSIGMDVAGPVGRWRRCRRLRYSTAVP
jgi:hypothetical protein